MGEEDDLLVRELGKLGAAGAGPAGEAGARLTAGFLPTERHRAELTLRADPRRVLAAVYACIAGNGRILDPEELQPCPNPALSGVVGSGFFNLNPALVHAEIVGVDGESCSVTLTAAAKEGLIKQRSAEKAVARLVEALRPLV